MAAKNDWTRLRDLFDRTANLDAAERERLLDRECGEEPDLRRQVQEMLAAHDAAGGFMADPTGPQAGGRTQARVATDPEAGATIGPYKLLHQIGEGGFGVVYMAEQREPIVRRVALKVIKLGMDTKQVIARFEAERQALALMDHPNIARIFDAGATESGRPYFVMELVHGIPITEYCDREQLSTRQRLELFIPVCQAVAHAHQKGIIHRDLKPSNVMVTLHDGIPVPKVIDFGIARAVNQRLTERTLFTEYGQLIGTPEYMSPEQAEMSGLDIDTRSDIYSLGALLYELLTGEMLFDPKLLRSVALREIQRVICEVEPARPSARVSSLGVSAMEIALHRGVQAPQLVRLLRGDLDWIVVKAIAKDRKRRYDSAGALVEDIERSLRSEPVAAGPPSRLYRLRKFAKRHKGPVAATLAVMVAVVTFGSLALWQGNKAMTEGFKARASAILAAAAAAKDPFVKALLVLELDKLPGLTTGELSEAQSVLGANLPVAVLGEETPYGSKAGSSSAALSPDGARVVIGSWDGTARVWRADGTGKPVVLSGHEHYASTPGANPFYFVGFSPDGKRVVTCGWDRTVRVWPSEGGEPVVLRGHQAEVSSAAWSSDGARLVTASDDGTARIWPADGVGNPIVLRGHAVELRRASFSPDGSLVVTVSADGEVRVWRADGTGAPVILKRREGRSTSAIFSPDGRLILGALEDGTALVWRTDGVGEPIVLKGHADRVTCFNFSADGQRIVTASSDRTARVWRTDGTGAPAVLKGHEDMLCWADFCPDGKRILTASEDGTARIWEPFATNTEIGVVSQSVPAEAYRGRRIRFRARVRVQGSGKAQLWVRIERRKGGGFFDNMSDRPITSRQWREYEIVGEVAEDALSINLGMVLSGSGRAWMDATSLEIMDGQVSSGQGLVDPGLEAEALQGWRSNSVNGYEAKMVDENSAEGRRCVRLESVEVQRYRSAVLASHGRGIRVAAIDALGRSLLTAGGDGAARVWRTDGMGEPVTLKVHTSVVVSATFSPDGRRVVTASWDGTARVCRTDGFGVPLILHGHKGALYTSVFSPDGRRIVTASADGTARVWHADGSGVPVVLRGHEGPVPAAAVSPDGEHIVTAAWDGTVRVWRANGIGEPVVLKGHEAWVYGATFSPDGRRVVTASKDSTARVWRADGSVEPIVLRGHEGPVLGATFSPDGKRIITASFDGTTRVWRADGFGEPLVLKGRNAAFSPDGQRIVTTSADGTASVWRTDGSGKPLVLKGHNAAVNSAAFSPDGRRIVTASWDGTARVWRADGTGEPLVLRGHDAEVNTAAFSPDGRRVITASSDGRVRIWRVTWEGLFDYLHANVSACLGPEERTQYLGESRSEAWQRYAECERLHGRTPRLQDAK